MAEAEASDGGTPTEGIRVTDIPDRVAAEALALEIRRLAEALGIEIQAVRVERAADAPRDDAP